ncbi:AMP-binding enzyme [Streptomyces sp. NBC_00063]|uniref:AMP-binding enzyme n=1 Tax=Streptomyces sp. NBC_00063 TaxID=2975638 RepID=UPI003D7595BC
MEAEAALIGHPQSADVVVVGLRDPDWGRRAHVVVEPADPGEPPTAEELIANAKVRLAPIRCGRTWSFEVDAPQCCDQGQPRRPGCGARGITPRPPSAIADALSRRSAAAWAVRRRLPRAGPRPRGRAGPCGAKRG